MLSNDLPEQLLVIDRKPFRQVDGLQLAAVQQLKHLRRNVTRPARPGPEHYLLGYRAFRFLLHPAGIRVAKGKAAKKWRCVGGVEKF